MANAVSGPSRLNVEVSGCEDGRLPESTAHCSPKNGTPELLSICMKERSYAQPASDRVARLITMILALILDITNTTAAEEQT